MKKKFVHSLKLQKHEQWKEYIKSGKKPDDIPSAPNETYKKEWKGVGDFLGTGRFSPKSKPSLFIEARKFVHSLKLRNCFFIHFFFLTRFSV